MTQSDIGKYIESVTPDWPECLDFHQRTIEALDITLKRAEAAEAQRDTARQELRDIRSAIDADENESTFDEVVRKVAQLESEITYLRSTDHAADIAMTQYLDGVLGEDGEEWRP